MTWRARLMGALSVAATIGLGFGLGLGLGACAPEPAGNCNPGTTNCGCNLGQCVPGLQCVAGFCIPGGTGDGDGDETTGPGDGDGDGCAADETECDGACVDVLTDPQHCGDCGVACPGACVSGECEALDCTQDPCPQGSYCDPDTLECMTGCDSDDDCMDGSCDLGTHMCGLGDGDPCDIYEQNCLPDYKCNPTLNPPVCTPLPADPAPLGGSCELADDDCDAGGICLYIGDDAIGVCYPLCGGNAINPTCGANEFCTMTVPKLCVEACDPLVQDCGGGEGCYAFGGDMMFGCLPEADAVPLGEACGFLNDCEAGTSCHPDNEVCAAYCEVANPPFDCVCDELFDGIGVCS